MEGNFLSLKSQKSYTSLNIVFVGDLKVGKTTLLSQIVTPGNKDPVEATIAVDYQLKEYKSFVLNFWDVSGNPCFQSVRQQFYEKTSVFVLVFDISSRNSFENLNEWIEEIGKFANLETKIVICANKIDLFNARQVSETEGGLFASMKEFLYFEVSAATGQGVKEMIDKVISGARETI